MLIQVNKKIAKLVKRGEGKVMWLLSKVVSLTIMFFVLN